MKIKPGIYKEEYNWQKYITFRRPGDKKMSLVTLRRMAALARDLNMPMTNIGGARDTARQKQLWDADLKAHNGTPSGKVARPGTSWHEAGLAADLDGTKWREYSEEHWVPFKKQRQPIYYAYGLMIPLNAVDSPGTVEWWHLQPVETAGVPADKRMTFLDQDDFMVGRFPVLKCGDRGEWVRELRVLLRCAPYNDVFDVHLYDAVVTYQRLNKLKPDGIAGPATFSVLYGL